MHENNKMLNLLLWLQTPTTIVTAARDRIYFHDCYMNGKTRVKCAVEYENKKTK